jgi:hypothetical protein
MLSINNLPKSPSVHLQLKNWLSVDKVVPVKGYKLKSKNNGRVS